MSFSFSFPSLAKMERVKSRISQICDKWGRNQKTGHMNKLSQRWRGGGRGMRGPVSCAPHSLLPIQGLYEPFMTWWRVRKWSPSPIATHRVPRHFSQLRAPSAAITLQTWHASQIQAFVYPFLLPHMRTTSLSGKTILWLPNTAQCGPN